MLGMTKEEAAIICQRRYRDRLRKRKEEEERRWLRLIGSLVPFQANARGLLARRCHHEKELEKKDIMNQAATLMQAITRGFLERRRHAKRVKEEEEAEAKRRAEEEALFLRMKSAAKKMQRWWRKISMRMLSAISVVLGFQHFEKTPDLVDCFRGKKLIQKLFNIFSSRRDYCSTIF